ncbi:MAG: M56 family metallopeptidase, partial [Planctomycetota bacterium]
MNPFDASWLTTLATASFSLTIAAVIVGGLWRLSPLRSPRLRQWVLLAVLVQGVSWAGMPVELHWLPSDRGPSQSASKGSLPHSAETWTAATSNTELQRDGFSWTSGSSADQPGDESRVQRSREAIISAILTSVLVVWWVGVVGLAGIAWYRYRQLGRAVARLPLAESWANEEWLRLCVSRGVTAPVMRLSDSASTGPFLIFGRRGYQFIVPREMWRGLTARQRTSVMLHELQHIRRGDVWLQLLVRSIATLHWFNPAAWWCVRRFEEAAEWACDQAVTQSDPRAACDFATALIRFVAAAEAGHSAGGCSRWRQAQTQTLGTQAMTAPPLTQRITRLVRPSIGDSLVKRLALVALAVVSLIASVVQFELVAAKADESANRDGKTVSTPEQLSKLQGSLDDYDPTTRRLASLLETAEGRLAFQGYAQSLRSQSAESRKSEGETLFLARFFDRTPNGGMTLKPGTESTVSKWIKKSERLDGQLKSMEARLRDMSERMTETTEASRLAKRLLDTDEVAVALMMTGLKGRLDMIDQFIGKATDQILVRKGSKMIVLPGRSVEISSKIDQLETASRIASLLQEELP